MRATTELCVFACILTLLTAGCRAAGPAGPETAERETALSDDPCYPNASPC
jgi:hypothetical protein